LAYLQPDLTDDAGSFTVTDVQPHILSAKSKTNSADSPTYTQAINSPHAEKWWEAMESKLTTLESELQAWELVPREPWMHVLPSMWAFHLKCFPNGLAKKFEARFCMRGNRQVESVDFFETWAPVVQWTMVRSMMVLATRMNLVSAQADITAAFVHAPLGPDEHIYVRQPAGFQHDGDLVLKLMKSVYGLHQSPRNFFNYLSDHLGAQGLLPSKLVPSLIRVSLWASPWWW
jgi:ATP-binding cassette subfamily B (MDR/TAP) protein 1